MKANGGAEVQLHSFLTSGPDGDDWSTSRIDCFTPRGNRLRYPLNRPMRGPRGRAGQFKEEKIFLLLAE